MARFTGIDVIDSPRRRRSRFPQIVLFLLLLIVTPPLLEFTKYRLAERELIRTSGPVETPLLNALSAGWEAGFSELRDWAAPLAARRTWNPRSVLPIAFFWTGVAALMLRKGHQ